MTGRRLSMLGFMNKVDLHIIILMAKYKIV